MNYMEEVVVESSAGKFARILAIVIFSLTMGALATAITADIVIFAEQIITFIFACIASVVVFIFGFILVIISCVLIFGIFILENYGFWPITWAEDAFREIMADAIPTQEQITTMAIIRINLIVLCLIIFVFSIICLSLNKKAKKSGAAIKVKRTKAFGVLSLIFSLLGVFMGLGTLLILSLF